MKKKKKPDFSKPKQLDATQEIQQINAEETDYSESFEEKPVHEKLKDGISTKQAGKKVIEEVLLIDSVATIFSCPKCT